MFQRREQKILNSTSEHTYLDFQYRGKKKFLNENIGKCRSCLGLCINNVLPRIGKFWDKGKSDRIVSGLPHCILFFGPSLKMFHVKDFSFNFKKLATSLATQYEKKYKSNE